MPSSSVTQGPDRRLTRSPRFFGRPPGPVAPEPSTIAAITTSMTRPAFDLLDPEFYAGDQHAAYTWMRANEPVYRDEANGLWAVTRHADVLDVERRGDVFVSGQGYRSLHVARRDQHDRPGRSRATPSSAGSSPGGSRPRRCARHEPLAPVDDRRAGRRVRRRRSDRGGRRPRRPAARRRLTADLLGFARGPVARHQGVVRAADAPRPSAVDDPTRGRGCHGGDHASSAGDLGRDRRAARAARPTTSCRCGPTPRSTASRSTASIMHETGLFISGGAETTRTAIARGARTFCRPPRPVGAAGRRPELVPGAVEEVIRWVTPLNNMFRTAAADTDDRRAARRRAATGSCCSYPSANRDEAVFDDPFRFDIPRDPNPHVAFGFGTHFCLGRHARPRSSCACCSSELTQRLTNLRVVTEPDIEPNIFVGAVATLRPRVRSSLT